jgi:hypothetical protein
MEAGYLTPLLDMFRQPGIDRDLKLVAASGTLTLRPDEHRSLLALLAQDEDEEVSRLATSSLALVASAEEPLSDAGAGDGSPVPMETDGDAPTNDLEGERETDEEKTRGLTERLAAMNPAQRLGRAMKGTREERAILVRDPNKIVALAVLSSPKISDAEVEAIAKMANVSDDVLRVIGRTRAWVKNYRVVMALSHNPRTPLAVSLGLLPRLNEKDAKILSADRNVPDPLRIAARRRQVPR